MTMEIQIKRVGDAGVCIEMPMLSANSLIRLWKERLITDMLLMAFSNRPITLITVDPGKDAIGYEFPYSLVVSGGKSYLVNSLENCTYSDLVKIGESADIRLGQLAVVAGTGHYAFKSFFPHDESKFGDVNEELFKCSPDGYRAYWIHPERAYNQLLESVQDIASFYLIGVAL
jgi:hypothetical protein